MDGFKHIISCLFLVFIVTMFNFYRDVIKRDKEFNKKQSRNSDSKLAELNNINPVNNNNNTTNNNNSNINSEYENIQWIKNAIEENTIAFQLREHTNYCLAIHAILFKPNYLLQYFNNHNNDGEGDDDEGDNNNRIENVIGEQSQHFLFNNLNENIKEYYFKMNNKIVADGFNDYINNNNDNDDDDDNIIDDIDGNKNIIDSLKIDSELLQSSSTVIKKKVSTSVSSSASSPQSPQPPHIDGSSSSSTIIKEKSTSSNNSIIYVFVTILIISLIKAAYDISKHLKDKKNNAAAAAAAGTGNDSEYLRRCSLQEYSKRQYRKKSLNRGSVIGNNNDGAGAGADDGGGGFVGRTGVKEGMIGGITTGIPNIDDDKLLSKSEMLKKFKGQRSLDILYKNINYTNYNTIISSNLHNYNNNNNNNHHHHMDKKKCTYISTKMNSQSVYYNNILNNINSNNTSTNSIGSGITTEPGSPAKPGNLIAGRPMPLIRRSSVPALMNKNLNLLGKSRRPSMDSLTEDDASPKRVRMINRH